MKTIINILIELLPYILIQRRAIAEFVWHCATDKSLDNMEQTLLIDCASKKVLIYSSWSIVIGLIGGNAFLDVLIWLDKNLLLFLYKNPR